MIAVIFTSQLQPTEIGYEEMALLLEKSVQNQPGFIKMVSARNKVGITVCYWENLDAIEAWRNNLEHQKAISKGKSEWYSHYEVVIANVLKSYQHG